MIIYIPSEAALTAKAYQCKVKQFITIRAADNQLNLRLGQVPLSSPRHSLSLFLTLLPPVPSFLSKPPRTAPSIMCHEKFHKFDISFLKRTTSYFHAPEGREQISSNYSA